MADGSVKIESQATGPGAPGPPAKKATKVKKAKKARPAKTTREPSSITFPYREMDVGISVALAMLEAGGVPLTSEQLAGVMKLQPGSGNFVLKVATARIFGLIANVQGKYELTNVGFSIVDKDDKRQRAARAEAFLNVPLYRRVYDEFKGKQLPPRPHGLEQAFIKFGVAPKQKQAARLAFDKSAQQAGFFAAGDDRLVEPIVGSVAPLDRNRPVADEPSKGAEKPHLMTNDASKVSGLHPFIQGLLDTLPAPETNWTVEGRAKWLQAAAHCFDLIYMGSGEIHITAKSEHPRESVSETARQPAHDLVSNKPRGPEPVRS